jgi:hypothetical protein
MDREWLMRAAADPGENKETRIGSALLLFEKYPDGGARRAAMEASLLRVKPLDTEWSSGLDWRLKLPVAAKAIQYPELMPVFVEKAVHEPQHDMEPIWPLNEYRRAGINPLPELEQWKAQLADPVLKDWCDRLLERVDPVRSKKFHEEQRKALSKKQREFDAAKAAEEAKIAAATAATAGGGSGSQSAPESRQSFWLVIGALALALIASVFWWWRGRRMAR